MVYMAAGDDLELDAHAVRDLQEMQRGMAGAACRLLVQVDRPWPPRPQRLEVDATRVRVLNGNVTGDNMGRPGSLRSFLTWAQRVAPADHFFLVLWGHAYGLGFGRDHGDPLTLKELREELRRFHDARGKPLDLLGANACAMSYAEAAFELQGHVDYLVASQIAVPFAGWPYEAILSTIGPTTTARELGEVVVERYVSHFEASPDGEQVAMTLLNLGQVGPLKQHIDHLAQAIDAAVAHADPLTNRLAHVRAAFLATAAGDVRPLIDLTDLCLKLIELCDDLADIEDPPPPDTVVDRTLMKGSLAALRTAAGNLLAQLTPGTTCVHGRNRLTTGGTPLIVAHKRHDDLDGLHGLGIFAPFVTDESDLARLGLLTDKADEGRNAYRALLLNVKGRWAPLVYDRLRGGLPSDVLSGVEVTGATSHADRSAVAQMLTAVDSAFTTLERCLDATRARTLASPQPANPGAGLAPPPALSPDTLGLFGTLRLLPMGDLRTIQNGALPTAGGPPAGSGGGSPPVEVTNTVNALSHLEATIAGVERAVRRTVTNGAFGLGPGTNGVLGKRDLGKRDLGKRDLGKRDLGKRDLGKRDLGKRDLGKRDLGTLMTQPFGVPTPAAVIAELFDQVGEALQGIERSTAAFERAMAESLAGGATVPGLAAAEAARQARARAERALRLVCEAALDARRILRRVLADPVYGFGPGPEELTADDRRELARAGGMNGEQLVLL